VTTPRSLTFLACLAIAVGFAAAAPAATGTPPVHKLSATSHGVTVRARVFTFCRTLTDPAGTGTGLCSDGVPGATYRRLPVHPGGSVLIAVGAPVTSLTARYATADGAGAARTLKVTRLGTGHRRFKISLPASRPAALLIVSTTYRDVPTADGKRDSGDAAFSIGLRLHRHRYR
jgi:hypothetical protein